MIGRRAHKPLRRRNQRRIDVVFYMPFVGAILSTGGVWPPGGAETQILRLARVLVRRGLKVAIIAYGAPEELPREVDGVQIVPRPPHRRRRAVGKLVEASRIWTALWHCPSRTVVYRCAGVELALLGLYTKASRRKLVFSTANVVDFDFKQLARNRRDMMLYELGTRLADAIVVQTEEQVDMCRTAFGREATLIKSLAAIEDHRQAAPEAFLWVGRLVSYKRPLAYLDLARAVPEARFWMVGVPAPHDIAEAGLGEAVIAAADGISNLEMLAPRPHVELQELMARAVASVNTADFEGMPNVLLEAWCRGVPALVLTHDPNEVVSRYGLGGVADGSPERLAALAREQWRTRQDREEVSRRCREYVASHHAPDVVATEWMEVLGVEAPGDAQARETVEVELSCAG